MRKKHFAGVGLGLRREMIGELIDNIPSSVDFWEVAPENWIPLGGKYQKQLSRFTGASQFVINWGSRAAGYQLCKRCKSISRYT